MAITKILFIRARLDDRVAYAANEQKTSLDGSIEYAVNGEKTEQRLYEAAVNCGSPETAYAEMSATKNRWGKTGGVLGYHIIQSFDTGETTPDEAHEIGVELARRLFGERFEAVIGTHLNTDNLHNHIIINSVSFKDGKKYQSTKANMYHIREVSDQLCREHSLSVILSPQGRGAHYAEWKAKLGGKRTLRDAIREDVDGAIACCRAPSQFVGTLQKLGYEVKTDVKYIAVRPPGKERFTRLKSLGEGYDWHSIQQRIFEQQTVKALPEPRRAAPSRCYHVKGTFQPKKITGYRALYFQYLYKMGILPRKRAFSGRVPFCMREDVYKLERINAEAKLLCAHKLDTAEQLSAYVTSLSAHMTALTIKRKTLRNSLRTNGGKTQTEQIKAELADIASQMKTLRSELRLCADIQQRSGEIPAKLKQAKAEEKQYKQEMMKNEHERGRGGSGR